MTSEVIDMDRGRLIEDGTGCRIDEEAGEQQIDREEQSDDAPAEPEDQGDGAKGRHGYRDDQERCFPPRAERQQGGEGQEAHG